MAVDVIDVKHKWRSEPFRACTAFLALVRPSVFQEGAPEDLALLPVRAGRCEREHLGPVESIPCRPAFLMSLSSEVGRVDAQCLDPATQVGVVPTVGSEPQVPHDFGEVGATAYRLLENLPRVLHPSPHRAPYRIFVRFARKAIEGVRHLFDLAMHDPRRPSTGNDLITKNVRDSSGSWTSMHRRSQE